MPLDENDRLRAGMLPADPEDGTDPVWRESAADGWSEPLFFDDAEVPAFPLDVLPGWLARWAREQATAIQVACDLPALLGLAVLSLASAKRVAVEIKPGWREPTNIYTAIALAPGEGKSPIFTAATLPLREWERAQRVRLSTQIADFEERERTRDERARELRKKAAKARGEIERNQLEEELRLLAVERAEASAVVVPRLVADDATPEAVGRLLSQQRGRLGIFSSEGGPFAILAGRYSEGRTNCELFLKAHSGDAYDLDRIGRSSIHLNAPLLTVGLTVQPAVIAGLASTPEFRSLGLLARFLYSMPRSLLGGRAPDPAAVSEEARRGYALHVEELLGLEEELDPHGEIVATCTPLSDDARRLLVAFKAALEPRLGPPGDLHGMADWANKLPGVTARLAAILHVGAHGAAGLGAPIAGATFEGALKIAHYAIEHARAAFGLMGADVTTCLARAIWGFALRSGQATVSKHEVHRGLQSRVQRSVELDPALSLLVERGLLREVESPSLRKRGRPAGPSYEINPRARRH